MGRIAKIIFSTVLILMTAGPAFASVYAMPIKVRLQGPPQAAKAWEPFAGVFEIEAGVDVQLTDISFAGKGWSLKEMQAPKNLDLKQGQVVTLPFRAVPLDVEAPLGISFRLDGSPYQLTLRTGPEFLEQHLGPGEVEPMDGFDLEKSQLRWPDTSDSEREEAVLSRAKGEVLGEEGEPGSADKARNIRVTGTIIYDRWEDPTTLTNLVTEHLAGVRIEIYDEDSTWDELLAVTHTDANGNFDVSFRWDPCYFCDSAPDIYIDVRAESAELDVETSWLEKTYHWESWVVDNYGGSLLNFSMQLTSNLPPAHIFQTLNRGVDIFEAHGYNMDLVDVQWPGDADFYNPYFNEIHLTNARRWMEGTYLHEYGHFWDDQYANFPIPDYLNGVCDDASILGGHCQWCAELWSEDVENEAWATYVAYLLGRDMLTFNPPPYNFRNTEDTQPCADSNGVPCVCTPNLTEGFITAFLVDVADPFNENDQTHQPDFGDVLSLDGWTITSIADIEKPNSATAWWQALNGRYPQYKEELWETAKNNNLDFDMTPPGAILDLWSPTHDGVAASPDGTVELKWTTPADDASGIAGYSHVVSASRFTSPATDMDLGDVNFLNTIMIPPGTWYINVRAFDHSGKSSPDYATYGPFTIRDPYPADLIPRTPTGWDQPLVVYNTFYNSGDLRVPTVLWHGGVAPTYFAMGVYNNGESSFSEPTNFDTYLDGNIIDVTPLGGASPFMWFTRINYASTNVSGGRHTVGLVVDSQEVIPELNELNNSTGYQYIWNPLYMASGESIEAAPPPDPLGGVAEFGSAYYNADGYRISGTGNWSAVLAYASDPNQDYDVRLHQPRTSNTRGFDAYEAYSSEPAGHLDAVLVNRYNSGEQDWDIGVLGDQTIDPSLYSPSIVETVVSEFIGVAGTHTWHWAPKERLSLKEFRVFTLDADDLTITLQTNVPNMPVQLAWFGKAFNRGVLTDAVMTVTTDNTGRAVLDISTGFAGVGMHCLGIYRDPKFGDAAMELELTIAATPADLIPAIPEMWYAPLVPNSVQMPVGIYPDTLHGNTFMINGTYFNQAIYNAGGLGAGPFETSVWLDGIPMSGDIIWPGLPEGAVAVDLGTSRRSIRGGRHTISLHVDQPDSVLESNETNNVYGAQWVWSPLAMSFTATTARGQPPAVKGGWDDFTANEAKFYNCDGLRIAAPDPVLQLGSWQALAVLPRDSSAVGLMLHEVAAGVKDGYSGLTYLATSITGPGHLSYVLVNYNREAKRAFDVGITGEGPGNGYYARAVSSSNLGLDPTGSQGVHVMAALDFMHLYEMELSAGDYTVTVGAREGNLDWGVTAHADSTNRNPGFRTRAMALDYGNGSIQPAGIDERTSFTVAAPGKYCVAVFRPKSVDLQSAGSYELIINSGLSAVGDLPVITRTGLASIYPNPFNPQTTIAFDLLRSGRVDLEIFDVRGQKVNSLVAEDLPAGRHSVLWSGTDDNGQSVASGVYLVRLRAGGTNGVKRMVLIE